MIKTNKRKSAKKGSNLIYNFRGITVGVDAHIDPHSRGITLIALIITIIIMLLLVGVSITIAIKGGLFDVAKRAAKETEEAKKLEQELANGRVKIDGTWYDSIEDYVGGKVSDDQTEPEKPVDPEKPVEPETPPKDPSTGLSFYDDVEKDANGMLTENASYTSDGKTAVIPKGFKIVAGIEGTKSIADGLVIQDKDGNEFVWIPVEVIESDTEKEIASFYISFWANNERGLDLGSRYAEPWANGYTGEAKEYAEMVKSVYKNGGFYIGRYEAGSKTERTNTSNGTTEMVVKKDQFPYNYVGWGVSTSDYISDVVYGNLNQGKGAVYLSKNMYEGKDVGVTSTLCYGAQWDAVLDFIKDEEHIVTDTRSNWGNLYTGILANTGSSDAYVAKNIYDVAGNMYEWTMTVSTFYEGSRCMRSGGFRTIGTSASPALYGPYDVDYCFDTFGFRPALYIK